MQLHEAAQGQEHGEPGEEEWGYDWYGHYPQEFMERQGAPSSELTGDPQVDAMAKGKGKSKGKGKGLCFNCNQPGHRS